jgi:hypothetical protein
MAAGLSESGFFDVTLPLPPSPLLNSLGLQAPCLPPGGLPSTLQAYGNGAIDDTLAIQNAIYWAWTFPSNPPGAPPAGGGIGRTGGTVYFPSGIYLLGGTCNPHLYVPGNVSLIGAGAAGDLPSAAALPDQCPNTGCLNQNLNDTVLYWQALPEPFDPVKGPSFMVSLGWAGPDDTVQYNNQTNTNPCSLWTGRVAGLRFTINPNAGFRTDMPPDNLRGVASGTYLPFQVEGLYILFLHHAQGFTIEDNYFDLVDYATSVPSPVSISGTNTSPYAPPVPIIANGVIRRNVISASMGYTGGAGISIAGGPAGDPASHITIEDNIITGVADEIIGIHQVNNAVIRNNSCSGVKAGIWVLHSQHFLIDGNYVERGPAAPMPAWGLTTPTWWQGSLLFCGIEGDATVPPCTDGRITGNEFIVSPPAYIPPPDLPPGLPEPPAPPPGTAPGLPAPPNPPTLVPGPAGTNLPPGTYSARITYAPPLFPPPPATPYYLESAPSPEASQLIPGPADELQVGLPAPTHWLPGTTYSTGALVVYNQAFYACYPANSTGDQPSDASAVWGPVQAINIYLSRDAGQEQLQASVLLPGTPTWPCTGLAPGSPLPLGAHWFVQLGGLRRAIVAGNLCRCDTPYVATPAFMVEPFPPPGGVFGWTDSEGLDTDQIARPRDILIQANRATGAAVDLDPALTGQTLNGIVENQTLNGIVENVAPYRGPVGVFQMGERQWPPQTPVDPTWIPGPITWQGNEANSFMIFGTNSSFTITNRVIGGNPDGLQDVDGYLIPDALLLWSGTAATIPNQIVPAMNGGGVAFFPLRSGIVFAIKATIAGGIVPGNTLVVELAKNGASNPADNLEIDTTTPYAKRRYYGLSNPGANNRFAPTDYLQVNLALNIGQNAPSQAFSTLIELYGMYTDSSPTIGV